MDNTLKQMKNLNKTILGEVRKPRTNATKKPLKIVINKETKESCS